MKTSLNNTLLQQFRLELYQSFAARADALLELIDALASTTTARSVAELSLEACFLRQYSSLYAAIDQFFQAAKARQAADTGTVIDL